MKKTYIVVFLLINTFIYGWNMQEQNKLETATLASGCFWCTEAVFQKVKGVVSVESGYTGGTVVNPTYEDVCSGATGHAEAVQIKYNPDEISFYKLLEIFFKTHDPTTLNRQGADVGTQYRSAIFYHNAQQKEAALKVIKNLTDEKVFDKPIVTQVEKFEKFYVAENYHQDYYENNKYQPYCSFVITPKLEKFKKAFKDLLKND